MTRDISTSERASRKASYEKPRLLVFGDVRELTHAVGDRGNADTGVPGQFKSQIS